MFKKLIQEGKYEDVVMITDRETIELLRQAFEQIKWDDKVVKMARKPDVEKLLCFLHF